MAPMVAPSPARAVYADFIRDPLNRNNVDTAEETDRAEHNFDVVLETAAQTAKVLSRWTHFNTTPLHDLVIDLKGLLALVRRELNEQKGCHKYNGPNSVAQKGVRLPQRLRDHKCLCPLTVFLKLVANALGELNLHFDSSSNLQWKSITPLWNVLNRMQLRFKRSGVIYNASGEEVEGQNNKNSDIAPGIATTIMFHERNGRFVVTGTAPRYVRLTGLQRYAFDLREHYILGMEKMLPAGEAEHVRQLIEYSEGIKKESLASRKERPMREPKVGPAPGGPGIIAGCNGSFGNRGAYRPACLMDWFRFDIDRPNKAQDGEERISVIRRLSFEPRSCAEWELYVTIKFNPDPTQPRPPNPAIRRDTLTGTPKPATWHTNTTAGGAGPQKFPPSWRKQFPDADACRDPQPLPALHLPQPPSRVARPNEIPAKIGPRPMAATFDQSEKPSPPRHPAATQIIKPKKRSCLGF